MDESVLGANAARSLGSADQGAVVLVAKLTDENRPIFADLAIAAYIGERCIVCKREYTSVADFRERDPKRGHGDGFVIVDAACWDEHMSARAPQASETERLAQNTPSENPTQALRETQ